MIRPRKLGHIVLNVRDVEKCAQFYQEVLGFAESDRNDIGMVFLRCNSDHHSLALMPTQTAPLPPDRKRPGMNHFAWEVASLDDLKKAKGLLEARGVPILWSGQHGPGNNRGIYFTDPEGNVVELYCDLDQIGWDGRSRPREQWNRREGLDDL